MLSVENLSLHYGQSQILFDVSLKAQRGQVSCVMGTNGVGKTSLLKAVSGVLPISGGTITLQGSPMQTLPPHQRAQNGIAYVPQGREIFPLMTVRENLQSGYACLPKSEQKVPDQIYELFPVLKEMLNRRGGDLSGGQQQQLAIARALITKPKLLLLDEPTEGIQPNIIQQIGRVISFLRDEGDMAIVLVEQYFDFAYGIADHFYAMKRGAMVLDGAKDEVDRDTMLGLVAV
ncbi:urea ABC transporter ATP-binding subunit UrtE [Litoreibacter roseus]|uniref:ABC transporter ATP-binding protein n=1 Tax=Litoreibacter roseus TaxID=2601869 RepID=A0A6N6JDE4_9RHOB|nr:urea ABC transporter ATP-binding subunit UrtE [Litoreibacter roseus]GFE63212.1 ABC transporter ATP-binding protein [Litoreibacter roseus]